MNCNFNMNYDHTKPWISHVCIQNWDVKRVRAWAPSARAPRPNNYGINACTGMNIMSDRTYLEWETYHHSVAS